MEPGWYRKPWTISGSIICMMILFSGGSLGICHCRNKRRSAERQREEDYPQTWLALKEKEKKVDEPKEEVKKEKEKASSAETPFTLGDMRMDQIGASEV